MLMPEATDRVRLGGSDVEVTRLGLGTAPLGNLFHEVADDDAGAVVRTAVDLGLDYVDTAPFYGFGLAEGRVGEVLRGFTPDRRPTLSTKVGRLLVEKADGSDRITERDAYVVPDRVEVRWDLSADGIRRSIDDSLERLGLDHIDIAYLHDPDDRRDEAYATALPTLTALREEGVVRAIGSGMNQSAMLTGFVNDFDLDAVLIAGRYSLLDRRAAADLLPACLERDTAVVIGGVFNSGLLADPHGHARFDYEDAPKDLVDAALAMERTCTEFGVPLRAAALQFPFRHDAVTTVVIGADKPEQVREAVEGMAVDIPQECWDALEAFAPARLAA